MPTPKKGKEKRNNSSEQPNLLSKGTRKQEQIKSKSDRRK